jgi:hypothetical protein
MLGVSVLLFAGDCDGSPEGIPVGTMVGRPRVGRLVGE